MSQFSVNGCVFNRKFWSSWPCPLSVVTGRLTLGIISEPTDETSMALERDKHYKNASVGRVRGLAEVMQGSRTIF
jgi:hypothetical protein